MKIYLREGDERRPLMEVIFQHQPKGGGRQKRGLRQKKTGFENLWERPACCTPGTERAQCGWDIKARWESYKNRLEGN
jgi:hypothetical protein